MSASEHDSAVSPIATTGVARDSTNEPTHSAPSLTDLRGTVLDDRYELREVLGAGGMGAVFDAWDSLLDRPVAIKVMRPAYADREDYIKRFLREAQAASKVRHRNVVVSLDYGEANGLVYSVMERLVGQDLKRMLKGSPDQRLPWNQACRLLVQIASGLKAAHDQGVIHRDIKPANCFVTEEDDQPVVKLVDFGIAKFDHGSQEEPITRTSQVLGTPSYLAPELVRTRNPASTRSDVYSLGVMAHRMLTGRLPFGGETSFEVMYRACTEPVPRLRKRVPELPAAVENLVLQMLAKDPERRPADMAEVRQRLRTLVQLEPEPHMGRRRAVTGALFVVVALLGGVAWWALGGEGDPSQDAPANAVSRRADRDRTSDPSSDASASMRAPSPAPVTVEPSSVDESKEPLEAPPIVEGSTAQETTEPIPAEQAARSSDEAPHDQPATKSKSAHRPAGLPSDAVLKKRLERKIKTRCEAQMGGKRVTVSFFVTESGEINMLTAMPKTAAGECAKLQVQGTRFRARSGGDTPTKLVVE